MFIATVTSASPLRVLEDAAASDLAATALDRGDGWVPAVDDYVLVADVAGRLIVLGIA